MGAKWPVSSSSVSFLAADLEKAWELEEKEKKDERFARSAASAASSTGSGDGRAYPQPQYRFRHFVSDSFLGRFKSELDVSESSNGLVDRSKGRLSRTRSVKYLDGPDTSLNPLPNLHTRILNRGLWLDAGSRRVHESARRAE